MPPLRRNRDFVLLQGGQLLSSAGSQTTTIAYPLVVLATSHSPAQAGLVGFARLLPSALLTLVAGVAADRVDRRGLMIASDILRAVALGALGAALVAGTPPVWAILVVAVLEGVGISVFSVAENGALRAVVPPEQLADATGILIGRRAAVFLLGPPLGGLLFGLGHAVPFVIDAATYAASTVSLLAMRTPFQEAREHDGTRLRTQLADGLRFLWGQPFLRTTSAIYGIGNFMVPAVVLTLVVSARDQGLSGGRTGLLVALVGAATVVGSLPVAPRAPPAARAGDPPARAVELARAVGLRRPPGRLRAGGHARPVRGVRADHRLGGPDAAGRTDAGPPPRAGHQRGDDARPRDRAARPARGGGVDQRGLGAGDGRHDRGHGPGPRAVGNAEPGGARRAAARGPRPLRRPTRGLKARAQTPM